MSSLRSTLPGLISFSALLFSIQLNPALAADETLLGTRTPAKVDLRDGAVNYELGLRFTAAQDGRIKAIRFYKSPAERGTHTGRIYSATGQQLALVTFSGETASGWQQQALAVPLAISKNAIYTVTVNTGSTYYVATQGGFNSAITSGNLKSATGNNGVYGPVGAMPTKSYLQTNYFRDVVFEAGSSTPTWTNTSFAAQTGPFTAQFSAVPNLANQDVVVGLSNGASDSYLDLAAAVRFGQNGRIDVRDGATYRADTSITNVPGKSYRVRMAVNVATRRYSVYIQPQGESEALLADSYSFRDSQLGVNRLNNLAKFNEVGDVIMSGITVAASGTPSDSTAPTVSLTAPSPGSVLAGVATLSANASDNVAVAGVQFLFDGAPTGAEDNSAPYAVSLDTKLIANGSHTIAARARDAAGNLKTTAAVSVQVNNQTTTPPPSGAKPTATNTGWQPTGVTLSASGGMTITTSGTVIDGKSISGEIIIKASNVTIKRSRIRTAGYFPIRVMSGSNILIEDCEIDGLGGSSKGILVEDGASNVVIQRNNIHDSEDGLSLNGSGGITVRDNFIHTPRHSSEGHSDGAELYGGSHMIIQNNNFDYLNANTSAFNFSNAWGPITDVTFDGNWLAGGAFILYVDGNFSGGKIDNVRITNNKFVRGSAQYGTTVVRGNLGTITWTGNVYTDNNEPVSR